MCVRMHVRVCVCVCVSARACPLVRMCLCCSMSSVLALPVCLFFAACARAAAAAAAAAAPLAAVRRRGIGGLPLSPASSAHLVDVLTHAVRQICATPAIPALAAGHLWGRGLLPAGRQEEEHGLQHKMPAVNASSTSCSTNHVPFQVRCVSHRASSNPCQTMYKKNHLCETDA